MTAVVTAAARAVRPRDAGGDDGDARKDVGGREKAVGAKKRPNLARKSVKFVVESVLEAAENTFSLWSDVKKALRAETHGEHGHQCKRSCVEPLVWTNFLLIVPALMYYLNGFTMACAGVILSSSLSFLYHMYAEAVHWHLVADKIGALAAFASTVPHVAPLLSPIGLMVACFLVCLAFWFKHHQDHNYAVYHSLWHASIFVGQVFLTLHLDFTLLHLFA
ncbi:Hypothetical Protein FCC1311_027302 [Hondaea fermentalgiana]|uniref:Uncharacterized protein n=1 Tax=Hondaea fermentalgiana TaxID=2315210 RepID=A0A2R5G862_9STRA|nr:Hypothetical Protein FCC1311_027302 [Hondaea fermentalgiana]|eukprot:GBG26509.1 Hypothetical Protein FCC1311_027302 [Hondaea fermentalgiana]